MREEQQYIFIAVSGTFTGRPTVNYRASLDGSYILERSEASGGKEPTWEFVMYEDEQQAVAWMVWQQTEDDHWLERFSG